MGMCMIQLHIAAQVYLKKLRKVENSWVP